MTTASSATTAHSGKQCSLTAEASDVVCQTHQRSRAQVYQTSEQRVGCNVPDGKPSRAVCRCDAWQLRLTSIPDFGKSSASLAQSEGHVRDDASASAVDCWRSVLFLYTWSVSADHEPFVSRRPSCHRLGSCLINADSPVSPELQGCGLVYLLGCSAYLMGDIHQLDAAQDIRER